MEPKTRAQVRRGIQESRQGPSEPPAKPQPSKVSSMPAAPPPLQPQMPVTRVVTKVEKTSSFSDTFKGRLDWKIRHCGVPITSTPAPAEKKYGNHNGKIRGLLVPRQISDSDLDVISPIRKPEKSHSNPLPTSS